jgi:hypothetical protein
MNDNGHWMFSIGCWFIACTPGVNALLAYISLRDFKQADPSGSATYNLPTYSRRDKSLADVPE